MKFRKGFRIKKKKVLYCLLALVLCCCFVRNGMGLVKTNNRPNPGNSLSKQIKSKISDECKSSNPEDCLKYSLQLTSDLLSFTEKNDIENGKANCVGYAILCSRICNYSFEMNKLKYHAKPVVGYVTLYGINICNILKSLAPQKWKKFVKDHDFVELELEDKTIFFDASLYDYYLDCTTIVNHL
jgi:hypothetical protein